jgi:hypothetical protein
MGYNKNEYVFVSDVIQLRGLETIEGFYLGSYKDRPDINEINTLIQIIKHKNKVHNSPIYPSTASINHTGLGFEPTSIIIKGGGIDPSVWSLHDLKDGSITDLKTGEVK